MIFRKTCWYCGKKYKGKYCSKCGAMESEYKTCPDCGGQVDGKSKDCFQCGHVFGPTETLTKQERVASKANVMRVKYKNVIKGCMYAFIIGLAVLMIFKEIILK